MLRILRHVTLMARGPSGRFVIDLDPETKRALHGALAADGLTLKDWFRKQVATYLADRVQPSLPGLALKSHSRHASTKGAS